METKAPIWIVRAGERAVFVEEFLEKGIAAIGWAAVGPLTASTPDEELKQRFAESYPEEKEGWRLVAAAMVRRFAREIQPGDPIATWDRNRRVYPLGTVSGGLEWQDHDELSRFRKVQWTHEVDRDQLSVGARNSLGAIATLFRLSAEVAAEMWAKARP
jgi:restriction system protein